MSATTNGDGQQRLPVADARVVRRVLWRILADRPGVVARLLLANCAAVAVGLVTPWLLGRMIDAVGEGSATRQINELGLLIVASAVGYLLLARWAQYTNHRFGEDALSRLREEFIEGALALPLAVVDRAGAGDLMTRSSTDVGVVGVTLRDAAPQVLIATVQVVFVLAAIFLVHPLLGVCALVGLPAMAIVARWYLRRAGSAYLDEATASSVLSELMAATAEGARTVEVFGLHRTRVERIVRGIAGAERARMRTLWLRTMLFPVCDSAHFLPMVLTLMVAGALLTAGRLSIGAAVAASLYTLRLVDPMDQILMWMEQVQSSAASLARLKGVEQVRDVEAVSDVPPADGRIRVSDVHYAYRAGRDVLHGIDLTVEPGDRLTIVGPSGSGKSTLGRLLAGIDAPRTGNVTVGGVPASQLPTDQRRHVVLVTQEHHVFNDTVRQNLAIACTHAATDATLRDALAAVGADWVDTLPDGLDTELGPARTDLDAARAQQLALARVVLADPHTVVLDEATAMLNPVAAQRTERALAAALEGRTVVAIAHRLQTARDAHRVIIIVDGRIVELGTHDQLVAAGGAYAALWHSWHGGAAGA